uniref:Inositol monophosphatase 2 n=1 Tax=Cyprinus carpio TaxID=7962 RepID=A0A8C1UXC5_CYPCA
MKKLLSAPTHGVRIIGSSTLALCHIASGAAEAYYQYGLHCWDIAAAAVIIREAGGYVMDTTGQSRVCPVCYGCRKCTLGGHCYAVIKSVFNS